MPKAWFGEHQLKFAGKIAGNIYSETKPQTAAAESIIWKLNLNYVKSGWVKNATCNYVTVVVVEHE